VTDGAYDADNDEPLCFSHHDHLQKLHEKYSSLRAEKGVSEEAFGESYWSD
jgi:hypothetical protein